VNQGITGIRRDTQVPGYMRRDSERTMANADRSAWYSIPAGFPAGKPGGLNVHTTARSGIICILGLLIIISTAGANGDTIPPLPHLFYGNVTILGDPAPAGLPVNAMVKAGDSYVGGGTITSTFGRYGGPGPQDPKLIVSLDDQDAPGPLSVAFFVNGMPAVCREYDTGIWLETFPYSSGTVTNLDLNVAELILSADFSASETLGVAPLNVQFTDMSTGPHNSWEWSFGDGGTSTQQNPVHQYAAPGTYTVSLTVRDSSTSVSDTETKPGYITVTELPAPPVAAFTANVTEGVAPLVVRFTDLSTGLPFEWGWSFGDGGTSAFQNPVHTYTNPGVYTVSLSVRGISGIDSESKPGYITVRAPVPTANFTANQTEGVAPFTVAFTDHSTGYPQEWSWSFGDGGSSVSRNPVHTYNSAGIFTVTLTVENSAGTNTLTRRDYINVTSSLLPHASFTAVPVSGYDPLTVSFTDTSAGNPVAWSWSFGDGTYSDQQNPNHTYVAGTYSVTLTATNDKGSGSITKNNYITVYRRAAGGGGGGGGGGGNAVFFIGGTPNATATPTPTPTPAPPGGLVLGPDNTTIQEVTIVSPDGVASVRIGIGVRPVGPDGLPLREVSVLPLSKDMIPAGAPCTSVDYAYEVAPSGSTFDPAVMLVFAFTPEQWSVMRGDQPLIISYDPGTGAWTELATTVDDQAGTLTGQITRGGTYAVCMRAPPTTIPPTEPVIPITPVSGGIPFMVVIPVIVLLVVAVGALVYFMSTRRWKRGPPPEEGS
jgi:PKD repeat protein